MGRRAGKTFGASTTGYRYSGLNIAQELENGVVGADLLTGGVDEIFARTEGGESRTFLTDRLGSTLGLLDDSGQIRTSYAYEPFGGTFTSGEGDGNTIGFTGRELDATGLHYHRARYYNPDFGRFISEDPIGFAGGINQYAYVLNNPTNLFDPSGLDAWTRLMGGVRAVGGGFEVAAGVGLGTATGVSGVGAVAGAAVGLHGLDQVQAGLRELATGCSVDSFTSQGLQALGLSQSTANVTDAGISVVGSLGSGGATQAIRAGGARNIAYYEIGQKTLPRSSYEIYGKIADPVQRGRQIVADQGWPAALFIDFTGQWGQTIGTGTTPAGRGFLGAALVGGAEAGTCGCW